MPDGTIKYTITNKYVDDDAGGDLPLTGGNDVEYGSDAGTSTEGVLTVGNTEESIPMGDVSVAGALFWCENLDEDNSVSIRLQTGTSNDQILVPPLQQVQFFIGADITAPKWICAGGNALVKYRVIAGQ